MEEAKRCSSCGGKYIGEECSNCKKKPAEKKKK